MSTAAVEIPGYVAGIFTIDPGHSDAAFTVRHLMVSDDLRSANFFETDTYPTMAFRSTGIRHSGDGFDVNGELTLHGVTRPVTLALDVNRFTRDPDGGTRAGFSATTELDRGDFGISINIPRTAAGWSSATVSRSSARLKPSSTHPGRPTSSTPPPTSRREGQPLGR